MIPCTFCLPTMSSPTVQVMQTNTWSVLTRCEFSTVAFFALQAQIGFFGHQSLNAGLASLRAYLSNSIETGIEVDRLRSLLAPIWPLLEVSPWHLAEFASVTTSSMQTSMPIQMKGSPEGNRKSPPYLHQRQRWAVSYAGLPKKHIGATRRKWLRLNLQDRRQRRQNHSLFFLRQTRWRGSQFCSGLAHRGRIEMGTGC